MANTRETLRWKGWAGAGIAPPGCLSAGALESMRESGVSWGGNRLDARLLPGFVLTVKQRHERESVVFAIAQDGLAHHAVVAKAIALIDAAGADVGFEDVQPETMRVMFEKSARHCVFEQCSAESSMRCADCDALQVKRTMFGV